MIGRLPLDEQLVALKSALSRNEVLLEVLDRTASLALPGWYMTAGCLFQTVWNVVTGRQPTRGIKDYDVFYFDNGDLSWEAEDAVIRAGKEAFAGLPAEVEIRNEARVHLWYEQKFGVPCAPHPSTEAAIDCFAATTCCLGVRLEPGGRWRVYAPHGLSDVFNLVVRPNPVLAPKEVYEKKAARWRQQWPELTVLDWPTASHGRGASQREAPLCGCGGGGI
ncbi:nucleotidyltransferase family protein [Streptomyces sp. NPDC051636]|uniref:nucleotidyltransferase family protein n=1 Tax=Streptomyces sp. NPDC051636 TaxID=3365663 RepID=UPI0037B4DDD6